MNASGGLTSNPTPWSWQLGATRWCPAAAVRARVGRWQRAGRCAAAKVDEAGHCRCRCVHVCMSECKSGLHQRTACCRHARGWAPGPGKPFWGMSPEC